MTIEGMLREEIQDEFENLAKMEVGTDQYKTTVDGLTKLVDRVVEMEKIDLEHERETERQKADEELKAKQLKVDKTDKIIRNVLTGVSVISGIAVTIWGTLYTTNYEQTDSPTTTAERKFFGRLFDKH